MAWSERGGSAQRDGYGRAAAGAGPCDAGRRSYFEWVGLVSLVGPGRGLAFLALRQAGLELLLRLTEAPGQLRDLRPAKSTKAMITTMMHSLPLNMCASLPAMAPGPASECSVGAPGQGTLRHRAPDTPRVHSQGPLRMTTPRDLHELRRRARAAGCHRRRGPGGVERTRSSRRWSASTSSPVRSPSGGRCRRRRGRPERSDRAAARAWRVTVAPGRRPEHLDAFRPLHPRRRSPRPEPPRHLGAGRRRRPLRSADALDVVVVPCVAVDLAGNRLGFGAGYYDRALSDRVGAPRPSVQRSRPRSWPSSTPIRGTWRSTSSSPRARVIRPAR